MKDRAFGLLKGIYKKLPFNYKTKNKLKGVFYRIFGSFFKNTTSYRVWSQVNVKHQRTDVISVDYSEAGRYICNKKIAVQLHLYYIDLIGEFIRYFNNIPYKFDIMVSIADKSKKEFVVTELQKIKNVENVYVEVAGNRGRDVAPLISIFGKQILKYDYVMHVHSKKSLFTGGEQTEWRQYLLDALMGTAEIVKSHFFMLDKGDNAGIVYPETFYQMPYTGHTWLQNKESRDILLNRINVPVKSNDIYIDYPMGTMFIAKVNAIRQFFEAEIRVDEFPKEAGQTDGTIAHAFERCLSIVSAYNGYNLMIYNLKEKTYSYNHGFKNMGQYMIKTYSDMENELRTYEVVSFDIFDTLISRKISDSNAIEKLVELKADALYQEKTEFAKKRIQAEKNYRNKHPEKDADITDIYDELKKLTGWNSGKSDELLQLETDMEYSLAEPKEEVISVFKNIKDKYGIKVYLISDMHLRRTDIEKMLKKCGIMKNQYDELLLSSELNKRKDNGTMWEYFSKLHEGKRCIHVGDNEVSDVQLAGDYNITAYHLMSEKALFQLTNIGKNVDNMLCETASASVEYGLILNKLFKDPLKYNSSDFCVKISEPYEFGYGLMGPAILNYVLWITREAYEQGIKKILFFSREGYILNKIFKILIPYVEKELNIDGEYFYASRRALSMASIFNEDDIEEPLEIFYEGKLNNLISKRYGIEIEDLPDIDIKLPDNKNKVLKYLEPYKEHILDSAQRERENYNNYLKKCIGDIKENERIIVSDIGYSGTIQYYLSKLSKRAYDGRYFATDGKMKPLELKGNTIEGYYINGDSEQELSKSPLHRYHLIMESILIAPHGQLVRMDNDGNPVFEEKENKLYTKEMMEIHKGIEAYAKDYAEVMGNALLTELPDKKLAESLIEVIVKEDIISDAIADCIAVDDKYCSGEVKNAVQYYKKRN